MSVKSVKNIFFMLHPQNFDPFEFAASLPQMADFALAPDRNAITARGRFFQNFCEADNEPREFGRTFCTEKLFDK